MSLSLSCPTIVWYLFSERSKELNSPMFAEFKAQRISFKPIDIPYKGCLEWLTLSSHLQVKASLRSLQQFPHRVNVQHINLINMWLGSV